MNYTNIVAVVVSYNGLQDTANTIKALVGSVEHVCVVDNGSSINSLLILRELNKSDSITLIELGVNNGIGYALNQGLEFAKNSGYQWLLTMDQDSIISNTIVQFYVDAINSSNDIVCLTPSINVFGKELVQNSSLKAVPIREVNYAITSGNLIKISIFDHTGIFNEDLFIDCVDFEFSLRIKSFGYKIHHIRNAVIYHQLGAPHNVPSVFAWFYTSHSPLRRYYMYRNWGYIMKLFFFRYPKFIIKSTFIHVLLLCVIPFYDEKPRESLRYIYKGIRDFVKGRKGAFIKN